MIIRNMLPTDVEFAFKCTSSEGWEGETEEVFKSYLSWHPKGCFVAEIDSRKIGISVATPYHRNGFIGELIIIKEMRGNGYGKRVFKHTVDHLKSCGSENIYLDADPDAVSLYEGFGFKRTTQTLRFIGKMEETKISPVNNMSAADLEDVCRLDNKLFADDRSFFLKRRFELFPELCWIVRNNAAIKGYIFGRPGVNIISVAPLVILDNNKSTAVALMQAIAKETGGQTLYGSALASNKDAVTFFQSLENFKQKTPGWYMVLGDSENLGTDNKLYTIGSAAKG